MIATQRGPCQDHLKRTGRRVSQLKKHLCYDNLGSDKKRHGKLSKAVVLDTFALVPIENYL